MEPYVVIDKLVGETPLSAAETWRLTRPDLAGVPLSYAGRLDPMASGKLLVLIGEECKKQANYHDLDKEYQFSVLFGVTSDTADVLGRLESNDDVPIMTLPQLQAICDTYIGELRVPYPKFSSKTVAGKPLHMWTLEGRLNEITIPTRTSTIYELKTVSIETLTRDEVVDSALLKINSIPEVTDPRKALGEDFRRAPIRKDWEMFRDDTHKPNTYQVAHFRCVASSGTYMRTLATLIAKDAGTVGLAFSIHRTIIGTYVPNTKQWVKIF